MTVACEGAQLFYAYGWRTMIVRTGRGVGRLLPKAAWAAGCGGGWRTMIVRVGAGAGGAKGRGATIGKEISPQRQNPWGDRALQGSEDPYHSNSFPHRYAMMHYYTKSI